MNKRELKEAITTNWKSYRIPGGNNYQQRSRNCIYISAINSARHEMAKSLGGYQLRRFGDIRFSEEIINAFKVIEAETKRLFGSFLTHKSDFITECVPKKGGDRRVDLVRLSDNTRYEIETNHNIKKQDSVTLYI